MKRKTRIGFLFLGVALAAFVLLYAFAQRDRQAQQRQIDALVSQSLSEGSEAFGRYQSSQERESYLLGVSAFYQLKNLYPESSYYVEQFAAAYSQVYAKLLFHEDLEPAELQLLLDALEILQADPGDIRGYTSLEQFVNANGYT